MVCSEFLEEYVNRGLTEIFITDYDHKEERSGYQNEHTTETVVAKHHNTFVTCSVSLDIDFNPYRPSRDLSVSVPRPISETTYVAAIKGKERVDTPEALNELQKEKELRQKKQKAQNALDASAPSCPTHGKLVIRQNSKTKENFWGCARYPNCRVTSPFTAEHRRLYHNLANIR